MKKQEQSEQKNLLHQHWTIMSPVLHHGDANQVSLKGTKMSVKDKYKLHTYKICASFVISVKR